MGDVCFSGWVIDIMLVTLSVPAPPFPSKHSQKGVTGKAETLCITDKKEDTNWGISPREGGYGKVVWLHSDQ